MNILWIPHASGGTRTRDKYFIERMSLIGHKLHSICWDVLPGHSPSVFLNPRTYFRPLKNWTRMVDGVIYHHLPRLHNYWHLMGTYGKVPQLNQIWFHNLVRRIVKEYAIEIVICSQNFDLIGFPPFDLEVPLVFDYLDYLDCKWEELYIKNSSAVICASTTLLERAKKWSCNCYYVPNSVHIDLFSNARGQSIIDRLGLKDCKVLSLIGITAHQEFYWLEGIELARQKIPNLKCLFVGDNPTILPKIKKWVGNKNNTYIFTGHVPYADIPGYFAATDVGMFPGHKDIPGDMACHIKVIEYTAAGKPVVVPALEELKRWNFANIIFVDETPESFAKGIECALSNSFIYPDLSNFDLDKNTDKLIDILRGLVRKK